MVAHLHLQHNLHLLVTIHQAFIASKGAIFDCGRIAGQILILRAPPDFLSFLPLSFLFLFFLSNHRCSQPPPKTIGGCPFLASWFHPMLQPPLSFPSPVIENGSSESRARPPPRTTTNHMNHELRTTNKATNRLHPACPPHHSTSFASHRRHLHLHLRLHLQPPHLYAAAPVVPFSHRIASHRHHPPLHIPHTKYRLATLHHSCQQICQPLSYRNRFVQSSHQRWSPVRHRIRPTSWYLCLRNRLRPIPTAHLDQCAS